MERHDFCLSVKGPTYQHSYAVQEPYTSYKGIWLIPPGHFLVANKLGIQLFCYNFWGDYLANSEDTKDCFKSLTTSLKSRMDYSDTIGIPMSAGIDSGIIAFTADKLKVKYHIFSIVEIFGEKTEEADYILERIKRLKNVSKVTLLKCNEEHYQKALKEMYLNDYYDSEKFDNGNILMHTVFDAMKKEKIRVVIDGSGGDELFHGYKFRNDFKPVDDWPSPWKRNNFFYSLYTTLLDYTSKSDRAGAHFSIEARYPFQSVELMNVALKLKCSKTLKWPLRKFLAENTNYGPTMDVDLFGKFGFSIKNRNKKKMILDMQQAWCRLNKLVSLPQDPPEKFPFRMGLRMD